MLPRSYRRKTPTFLAFAHHWLVGVTIQSTLLRGDRFGDLGWWTHGWLLGALTMIAAAGCCYLAVQQLLVRIMTGRAWRREMRQLEAVEKELEGWGLQKPKIVIVDHADPGFTGGVVGWPGLETFRIPQLAGDALNAGTRRCDCPANAGRIIGKPSSRSAPSIHLDLVRFWICYTRARRRRSQCRTARYNLLWIYGLDVRRTVDFAHRESLCFLCDRQTSKRAGHSYPTVK